MRSRVDIVLRAPPGTSAAVAPAQEGHGTEERPPPPGLPRSRDMVEVKGELLVLRSELGKLQAGTNNTQKGSFVDDSDVRVPPYTLRDVLEMDLDATPTRARLLDIVSRAVASYMSEKNEAIKTSKIVQYDVGAVAALQLGITLSFDEVSLAALKRLLMSLGEQVPPPGITPVKGTTMPSGFSWQGDIDVLQDLDPEHIKTWIGLWRSNLNLNNAASHVRAAAEAWRHLATNVRKDIASMFDERLVHFSDAVIAALTVKATSREEVDRVRVELRALSCNDMADIPATWPKFVDLIKGSGYDLAGRDAWYAFIRTFAPLGQFVKEIASRGIGRDVRDFKSELHFGREQDEAFQAGLSGKREKQPDKQSHKRGAEQVTAAVEVTTKRTRRDDLTCFQCGQKGHLVRNCTQQGGRRGRAKNEQDGQHRSQRTVPLTDGQQLPLQQFRHDTGTAARMGGPGSPRRVKAIVINKPTSGMSIAYVAFDAEARSEVEVCNNALKGRCTFGPRCRYLHPTDDAERDSWAQQIDQLGTGAQRTAIPATRPRRGQGPPGTYTGPQAPPAQANALYPPWSAATWPQQTPVFVRTYGDTFE